MISGREQGLKASALRLLLRIASAFYGIAVRLRNLLYDLGVMRSRPANATVICVGNITAGGTGKTPLVVWLCNLLLARKIPTTVLTRGYKTDSAKRLPHIDEPALLAQSCPGLQVVVNPDRVAGAAEAAGTLGAQVLVMDDGFQHRRLTRDLDIIAIDATDPFGGGRILPAGLLREPLSSLARAQAAVITRSDLVSEEQLASIEQRLKAIHPRVVLVRAAHAPVSIFTQSGDSLPLGEVDGKRVLGFCGIGNPAAFFETVRRIGCELVETLTFDDHHHYSREDIAEIASRARQVGAELVLTTQKDWVSSPFSQIDENKTPKDEANFAFLNIELQFTTGTEQLTALIERALEGRIISLQ